MKRAKDECDKIFNCPFCNYYKVVECKLDRKTNIGRLVCRICGASYQSSINYLSEPIDVFSEWIDDCMKITDHNAEPNEDDDEASPGEDPDGQGFEPASGSGADDQGQAPDDVDMGPIVEEEPVDDNTLDMPNLDALDDMYDDATHDPGHDLGQFGDMGGQDGLSQNQFEDFRERQVGIKQEAQSEFLTAEEQQQQALYDEQRAPQTGIKQEQQNIPQEEQPVGEEQPRRTGIKEEQQADTIISPDDEFEAQDEPEQGQPEVGDTRPLPHDAPGEAGDHEESEPQHKKQRTDLDEQAAEHAQAADPAQELTEAYPAQDPSQGFAEAYPAQDPPQEFTEADPAQDHIQEFAEADPAQELNVADPAQELLEADPAQNLPVVDPAQELIKRGILEEADFSD